MLVPRPPASLDTGWDKLNHVLAFAGPAWAGLIALRRDDRRAHAGLLMALLLWGAALEGLQTLMPPRQGDLADLVADGVGLLAGWLVYRLTRRWLSV